MVNLTDFIFLILISLSAIVGFSKGLIQELLSLTIWIIAFLIMIHFAQDVSILLIPHINDENYRFPTAVALLFLPSLIILSIIKRSIIKFFLRGGPDSHDHLLGLLFGAIRGAMIIVVVVILGGGPTGLYEQQWWIESRVISFTIPALNTIRPYVPDDIGQYIDANNQPTKTRRIKLQADINGHYIVQGKINDQPVSLLIDTGASVVSIPAHIAARIGIQTTASEDVMMTAAGRQKVSRVTLQSVRVGNIVLENVAGAILPSTESDATLLGMSFLRRLTFNQSEHTLELEQKVR